MAWFRFLCLLAGLLGLAFVPVRAGDPVLTDKKGDAKKAPITNYVRLTRNDKGELKALETSVAQFASDKGGVTVDLVSAVHVGDKAYYRALNRQLATYDVVLYELVAPPGTRIPKGGKREVTNPLGLLQHAMKSMLDLESQTEQVDYTKANFVHADLSFEQMREKMKERGDDGWTIALGLVTDMLRQQNRQEQSATTKPGKPPQELDLQSLLNDPDASLKLKRMMAEQMAGSDLGGVGLGQTLNTLLVADRNQAAMKALHAEIAKGKKKIAIFYGAAHMPDFEKRLKDELGMTRQSEKWLMAWDLE